MFKAQGAKKLVFAGVGAVLVLALGLPLTALAQTSGQGLEISPPLIDQKVDPGQTYTLNIRLRNITGTKVVAKARLDDFVAGGEDGQPQVLTDTNEASPYSFKSWVSGISDLEIDPQEQKTAAITVKVPADAAPGGHYGVVRYTAVPVDLKDTGVSLSASIGSLVLLSVSGEVSTQANIEEFFVSQNNKRGSIFEKLPLSFTERIKNSGNVHIKPTGHVKVKNLFGHEVAQLEVNKNGGNILPASIRKFDQTLEGKTMFGRYSAEMHLTYGDNQELMRTLSFWVIPYKLIAIIVAGLIIIITLIRLGLRRYKRGVLAHDQTPPPPPSVNPPNQS